MGAHGNQGYSGAGVASGICPEFSVFDAGLMAKLAADEAVRNLVVTGIDPNKIALIDNFCWPDPLPGTKNPDAEHKLAQLVRACRSLAEVVRTYDMPLISGKDSMKNDFIGSFSNGKEVKISVLPTLLVTALGYHPDVRRAVKSHANSGTWIYLLGQPTVTSSSYFGTTLAKYFEVESAQALEDWNLQQTRALYETFFKAAQEGLIQSAHDLSEGGLLVSLFETLLLNQAGITMDWLHLKDATSFAFSEFPGRMLVSITPSQAPQFEQHFVGHSVIKIGETNASGKIVIKTKDPTQEKTETLSVSALEQIWKGVL